MKHTLILLLHAFIGWAICACDHRSWVQPYNRVQYSSHPRLCGAGCIRCHCLELFSQVSLYISIDDCMYFPDFHGRHRFLFSRVNHTKEFCHVSQYLRNLDSIHFDFPNDLYRRDIQQEDPDITCSQHIEKYYVDALGHLFLHPRIHLLTAFIWRFISLVVHSLVRPGWAGSLNLIIHLLKPIERALSSSAWIFEPG